MAVARRACAQCGIKRDEDKYTSARGKICEKCRKANTKAGARVRHLAKYGITPSEYDEMSKDGCQACGGSRPYNLAVDHAHDIAEQFGIRESVRGTLCKRCNGALADVRDSPELLQALANYLLNPPAKRVLFP